MFSIVSREATGKVVFFLQRDKGVIMNLYVYSDESGVFDCEHNDYFVFGGVILIGQELNEEWNR